MLPIKFIIGSCIELSAEILRLFDLIPDISDTLHDWAFDLITTLSDTSKSDNKNIIGELDHDISKQINTQTEVKNQFNNPPL